MMKCNAFTMANKQPHKKRLIDQEFIVLESLSPDTLLPLQYIKELLELQGPLQMLKN